MLDDWLTYIAGRCTFTVAACSVHMLLIWTAQTWIKSAPWLHKGGCRLSCQSLLHHQVQNLICRPAQLSYYAPPVRKGALSDDTRLTSVWLTSVCRVHRA